LRPAANAAGSPGDEAQLVELSKSWSTAMNGHGRATWFDALFNHVKILEFE
jgi:hypothetical protein